jgi:ATP-dependent Clp protease ATP-binding subunit ClpC
MHQPLSSAAKAALEAAQHEARSLNQEFVGTEHLLLGVIAGTGTLATRLLRQYHVDRDALRTQIRSTLPFSENPPNVTGQLPLSPRAQRVINSALVMARSLRENVISSRLLLLALLDDARASILQSMQSGGVDVEGLLKALAEKPAEAEM